MAAVSGLYERIASGDYKRTESGDFSPDAASSIVPWLDEERRVRLAADVLDVFFFAEPDFVQHWLDWAVAASLDTGTPPLDDPLDLLTPYLAESGPRRCGYIFNDGDISWHCRTCQADDTCVMCQDCFNASPSHRDHEVYFYRTRAGGCCDCGDPEAWTSPCSCAIHGGKSAVHGVRPTAPASRCGTDSSTAESSAAAEPVPEDEGSPLPPGIISSLASVGSAALLSVLRRASATRCRFDWDEAVAEIQTRAAEAQACALAAAATPPPAAQTAGPTADPNVAAAVAAHAAAGDLAFKVAMERARRWCVRADFCLWLHADDVHSVEDVTREMMRLGHKRTSAAILAAAAAPTSKLGVAMVREGPLDYLSLAFSQLRRSGFHVSISPAADHSTERAAAAVRWLARIAAKSSALADAIVDALLSPPPCAVTATGRGGATAGSSDSAPETGVGGAIPVGGDAAQVSGESTATAEPVSAIASGLRAITDVDHRFSLPSTPGLLESAPHIERRAVILARDQIWTRNEATTVGGAAGERSPVAAPGLQPASPGATGAPSSLVGTALASACGAAYPPPEAATFSPSPGFTMVPVAAAAPPSPDAATAAARFGPTGDARTDEAAGWAQLMAEQAKGTSEASGVRTVLLPPSTPAERASDREPPAGTLPLESASPPASQPPPAPSTMLKLRVRLPVAHRSAGTRFAWHLPCACRRHVSRFSIATEGAGTAIVPWDASICKVQMPEMEAAETGRESEAARGVGGEEFCGGVSGVTTAGVRARDDDGGANGQGGEGHSGDGGDGDGGGGVSTEAHSCPTVLWWLMEADALLPRALTAELHRLYLACLCVPAFRLAFARTFSHLYFPLALRYTDGVGTKSETLLGLSTQLFTAPSLLLHTGPTAVLTSALLALDRLLHYASDLHAVEVAARYDATAAAAELPPAAATGTGGVANTGEGPFAEGTIPPTPPGPRPISVTSAGVRAPQYPHSPHSASSTAPGAAGSPAEWSARPPPSGICAWNRAKSISAEPGACFDWFSGEPQAALEPTPMPKLICGHEALEKRRYDVMTRDLDYILRSLSTTADAGTSSAAFSSSATSRSSAARSDSWATAHPLAAPHGEALLRRWLRILERMQGVDPRTRCTLAHAEHEHRDWIHAFNLGIGISSLFAPTLVAAGVDADELSGLAGSASGGFAPEETGSEDADHNVAAGGAGASPDVSTRVLRAQASATQAVATATLTPLLRWVRRDLPANSRYVRLAVPPPLLVQEGGPSVTCDPVPGGGAAAPASAGKRPALPAGTCADATGSSPASFSTSHKAQLCTDFPPNVLLLDGDICTRREGVSFHLPLHRFFAALLREAAATPQRVMQPTAAPSAAPTLPHDAPLRGAPPADPPPADAQLDLGSILDDVVREVSSWPAPASTLHQAHAIPHGEWFHSEIIKRNAARAASASTAAQLSSPHASSPLQITLGASSGDGAQTGHSCGGPPRGAACRTTPEESDLPLHSSESEDGDEGSGEDEDLSLSSAGSDDSGGNLGVRAGAGIDWHLRRLGITAQMRQEWEREDALREARPALREVLAGIVSGPGPSQPPSAQPLTSLGSGASSACPADASSSSDPKPKRVAPPDESPPEWPPRLGAAETKRLLLLQLVEHPLRVLTLSAQVGAHLWRRNGAEMLSQVLNYSAPPHCTRLRDLDLTLVQYVAACLSPTPRDLLLTLLHRFRLYGWAMRACAPCDAAAASSAARVIADYSDEARAVALSELETVLHCDDSQRMRLVAEAMQLILQIATALPPPPADPSGSVEPAAAHPPAAAPPARSLWHSDPARATLRRELIHRLAQSPASRSEAARVVELVPRPADTKRMAEALDSVLVEVAVRVPGGATPAGAMEAADGVRHGPKWRLKDELWAEVDPEHCHTALHFLRLAAGAGGAAGGGGGPTRVPRSAPSTAAVQGDAAAAFAWGTPLVGVPPPAHPFFARARRLLHEPLLACMVRAALATGNTDEVLSRSVQIITLAVHTLDDLDTGVDLDSEDDPNTHDAPPHFATVEADARSGGTQPALGAAATRRSRFLRSLCTPAPSVDALRVLPPTASPAVAAQEEPPELPDESYRDEETLHAAFVQQNLQAILKTLHPPPPPPEPELPEPTPESRQSDAAAAAAGAGTPRSSVIGLLHRLASGGRVGGDGGAAGGDAGARQPEETLRSGCAWLLHALAARDAGCASTLTWVTEAASKAEAEASAAAAAAGAEVSAESGDAKAAAAAERRARKKAAQQRALAQMARQADSFAALIGDSESGRTSSATTPAVSRAGSVTPTVSRGSSVAVPLAISRDASATVPLAVSRGSSVAVALPEDVSSAPPLAASIADAAAGSIAAEAEAAFRAEEETTPEPLRCIICHVTDADSDAPLGCIGFVQPSAALRCAREPRVHNAPHCADGCSLAASAAAVARASSARAESRSSATPSSPPGVAEPAVTAAIVAGGAEAPHGGADRSQKVEPDGREETPCADGQFAGRRELHTALCGHAVHFDCFTAHAASLRDRVERGVHSEGRSAVDVDRGEFLCPLCKRLSNIVVPHLAPAPHNSTLVHTVLLEPPDGISDDVVAGTHSSPAASRPDAAPHQASLPAPPPAPHLAIRAALAPFLANGDVRRQWPGFTLPFLAPAAKAPAGSLNPAELAGCSTAGPGGTARGTVESHSTASTAATLSPEGFGGKLSSLIRRLDSLRTAAEAERVAAGLAAAAETGAEQEADAGLSAYATSFLSPEARDLLGALLAGSTWLCQAAEAALQLEAPAAANAEQPPSALAPTSDAGAAPLPASVPPAAASPTGRGGGSDVAALAPLIGSFHAAGALCRALRARVPPLSPAPHTCAHERGQMSGTGAPAVGAASHPCGAVRRLLGAAEWGMSDAAACLPPWVDGCDAPTLRWLLELLAPTAAAAAAMAASQADGTVQAAFLPWDPAGRALSALADRRAALPAADPHAAAESAAEFLVGVGRGGWARLGWAAALPTAWGGQPPLSPSHRRWLVHALCNLRCLSAPPPPDGNPVEESSGGGLMGPGAQMLSALAEAVGGIAEGAAGIVDEGAQVAAEIAAEIAAGDDATLDEATFPIASAEGCGAMTEALWRTIAYTVLVEAEAEATPDDVAARTTATPCTHGVSAPSPAVPLASRLAQLGPLIRAARLWPFLFPCPEDATAFAAAPLARLLAEGEGAPPGSPLRRSTSWPAGGRQAAGDIEGGALSAILAGGAGAPEPGRHQLRLGIVHIRCGSAMLPHERLALLAQSLAMEDAPSIPPGAEAALSTVNLSRLANLSPLERQYELTLTDGSDQVIGCLAPHLGETLRLRPGGLLLLRDWVVDGSKLLLMDVAPLGEPTADGHASASAPVDDCSGLGMRRSAAFAAPLLLAPPHTLLTSALLCAADAPQLVSIVRALALSVVCRTLMLSARGGVSAPCDAAISAGWEVWTVLPVAATAHMPSAIGCGWPIHASPAPDAPVVCWLLPGNSVRACQDFEAGAGWMRVRMARAPQPGVNASSHAVGAEDDFGSSGGWTRTSLDSPTDCILVNDADAQEAAGAEGRSDDAAAAVVRLRSALGIPANPDAPSAAALSRLFDLEMLAFHRMARALMRTLLPAPAEADALLPPLAPGGRSYTDVLVAIGAPTPAAILGCPRLLRTMCKWVRVSQASLNAAHAPSSPATGSSALPAPPRPLADPATGAAPLPPTSLLLLSASGPAHLWQLPDRYTDLYSSPALRAHRCPATGKPPAEPAICLACGAVLCAGTACCKRDGVGALTRHACAECSEGAGLFLLVHKCQVILLRGGHAAYWCSPFVDEFGEEDSGLRRGRPLRLDPARVAGLQQLWTGHAIAGEVVRERSTRDRVIRDNYW